MRVGDGNGSLGGLPKARTVRLAVAVFLVLVGLVGMHGLGTHQMHDRSVAHDDRAPVQISAMPDMAAAGVAEMVVKASNELAGSPLDELCIAMLTVVGVALLLMRSRKSATNLRGRRADDLAAWAAVSRTSGPGPPSLAQLSILRC